MRICNCTLPYTNPSACKNCPNNKDFDASDTNHYQPYNLPAITPINKPFKRTIEEYDKDGKITKIIVEEYHVEPWPLYQLDISPTTVGDPTAGLPFTTCKTGDCHVNVT